MGHSRDPIAISWTCVGVGRRKEDSQEGSGAQFSCSMRGQKGHEVTRGVPRAGCGSRVSAVSMKRRRTGAENSLLSQVKSQGRARVLVA